MKTRLVLNGKNAEGKRVLLALMLKPEENMIDIWSIPDELVSDEFADKMMKEWRTGGELEMPEEKEYFERTLNMSESILPDGFIADRKDIVQRAQTEWHFVVLSSKLHSMYKEELGDLKERIDKLQSYEKYAWNELKEFWDKVQAQINERNLFRDHINDLRKGTNDLFGKLKEMRAKLDSEFKDKSKEHYDSISSSLQEIEEKINEGSKLSRVMEELKSLQARMKSIRLTKEHRSKLWDRLDAAFKEAKKKRFGDSGQQEYSAMTRIQRRYDGLLNAIEKMTRSIKKDEADLEFQDKRSELAGGQLEVQLRKAKIMMIEERIRSKKEKLSDMERTKADLEKRMAKEKKREEKRMQQEEIEKKKEEVKQKIAEEIKASAENLPDQEKEKLQEAADAIKESKQKKTKSSAPAAGVLSQITEVVGEVIEDVVDTAKAVAHVVEEKVETVVEDLKEEFKEEESGDEEE